MSRRNAHGNNTPVRADHTQRVATPGPGSREVTPVSLTALAIIAVLVLVLHIVAGAVLGHPQARASDCRTGPRSELPDGCRAADAVTAVRLANSLGGQTHAGSGDQSPVERRRVRRRLCLEPCRVCVLRGRGRDPAAYFSADGGGAPDDGLRYWCAGRQFVGAAPDHSVGRQPALDRRRRARHPGCDLPAAERGYAYSPGCLRDHRRPLRRLHAVPADAGARRGNDQPAAARR